MSITKNNTRMLDGSISDTQLASGVGTSANNLVKLDGTAKLPAVDGSQLTGISQSACAFKLTKTSGQSTPNGATVTVTWENDTIDTNNISDLTNNRITITSATAGLWFVGLNIAQDNLNFRASSSIRLNGSNQARFENATQSVANNGSRMPHLYVATILNLSAGDYIDAAYISINGTNNISNTTFATYFFGYKIA